MNNIKLADFTVEKARITEVVNKLARASQISICVEEVRWFDRKGDTDARVRELERERKMGFTFKLNQTTVEAILNKITTVDPDYTWERDGTTGIVNIYPKENAPLGWEIKNIAFKDKTFREIFISDDLLGLNVHGIEFFSGRGNLTWLDTLVSLNANNITARLALNQICKQLNFKARWELFELPSGRGTNALLMFQGYSRSPVRGWK